MTREENGKERKGDENVANCIDDSAYSFRVGSLWSGFALTNGKNIVEVCS